MGKAGQRPIFVTAIAVSLLAVGIATSVLARTSMEEEKVCPYDGVRFRFTGQGSGTSFGQQLDFRQVGMITSPWPIAVCPTNGFVFYKSNFDEAELEKLRPLVLSAEYQATKEETSYYRAFWLIDRSGGAHLSASEALLAATWQAGGDQYSRYAEELLARLPADVAAAEGAQRRKLIVLLGELLRRLGRFEDSAEHLKQWQSELGSTSTEGLIAAYELQLIALRDSEPHLIADAIEAGERDPAVWAARRSPTPVGDMMTRTNIFPFPSLRRPKIEWSADSMSIVGTEAPFAENSWDWRDKNFVRFDLLTDTRTVIKTPVGWSTIGRFQDGNTIVAIDRPDDSELRFLQIDGRSLEIRNVASGASQFAMSHDRLSLLAHTRQGLMAFDLGKDGLRPLLSPSFSKDPNRWQLIGADPWSPRIVVLHDQSVFIWNYEKGAFELELRPETWTGPGDAWTAQALYTADSQHLIVASPMRNGRAYEVAIWDIHTGQLVFRQQVAESDCQLAGSSDGYFVALGCWSGLYVSKRDIGDHFVKVLHAAESARIEEIAFSPDAKKLAARSMDALLIYAIRP